MAFSSRCLERLLVKRASYFGHEGTRCLRRNKKDSPRLHLPSSSLILWFNWNSLTGTATNRFTRNVNGNSWLTFFVFAHFSRLERRKPISLECPLFRERKFYSPLRNRKRLDTYERPYSLFNLRTVTNSFRVEKKKIARRMTTRKFNLKKQRSLIGSEFVPIKAQRRKFMAKVTRSEIARFFI